MKKWQRVFLFWMFCLIFFVVSPILVLYSQGFRLDFKKKTFVKTGGIFIKAYPKQVEVFLNEKLIKKTDFFFGSLLIQNLLPQKYKVKVKKEGFHPWEKNLEVYPGKVTEVKNLILFPQKIDFEKISSSVENFYPLSDQKRIILKEKSGEDWNLSLYDIFKKNIVPLINEKNLSKNGADLINFKETKNLNVLEIEAQIDKEIKNFSLDLTQIPPILKEKNEEKTNNFLAQKIVGDNNYYLDYFGNLFLNQEKINQAPLSVQKEKKYSIEVFKENIFIKESEKESENCFYYLNNETRSFEKIFCGGKTIKISPDEKKLVFLSKFEIWILYLKDELTQPINKAGEKFLLLRFSKNIEDVFWLNSNYLIFNAGNEIEIAEIDNRDKINIVTIANFKNPKIFWSNLDKRVYVLSEGGFLKSQPLLP